MWSFYIIDGLMLFSITLSLQKVEVIFDYSFPNSVDIRGS